MAMQVLVGSGLMPALLASISVLLVFLGLISMRSPSSLRDRMQMYSRAADQDPTTPATLEQLELDEPFSRRVLKPVVLQIVRLLGWVLPTKGMAGVRQRLVLAGEPGGLGAAEFVGIKAWTTIILGSLVALRLFLGAKPSPMITFAMIAWVLLGFKLPDIWLSIRIKRRQLELTNSLPDALDMLTIAVEAGLSFDQAIGEIVARWQNQLSGEFRRVLNEIGVGKSRREALEQMSQRTGVPDILSFVIAVNNAEELGTSLGRVLEVQSQEMRTRRRQRAQEAANKVPVKMMFPMVLLIFPAVWAVVLGPAIPRLLQGFGMIKIH